MQQLLKDLETTITKHIEQYMQRIKEKYPSTDIETLNALWKSETELKTLVSKTSSTGGCPYTSIKGKNAGKMCGIKPKDGGLYCGTHKKYEGKQPREKKIVPQPKSTSPKISNSESTSAQRIFRKYKGLDYLYHPQTNLVIKSPTDRYVIGKIVDGKVQELTDDDIEVCKQWGFPLLPKKEVENVQEEKANKETNLEEKAKVVPKKPKKTDSSDDEEEKAKVVPKKPKKTDSSDDEEEKAKVVPKKPKKTDSSDDEEEKAKVVPKKPKKTDSYSEKNSNDTEEYIKDLTEDTVVKALGLDEEEELEDE